MAQLFVIVGVPLVTALMGFTFVLTASTVTPDRAADAGLTEGSR